MTIKQKLEVLATERSTPCVTISLNTHRTHPDSEQDIIQLKNLIGEAEARLLKEFDKREIAQLLDNLSSVSSEIDVNYNLDSLHIYLSNDTKEVIRSTWTTTENAVYISDAFNIRSIIKSLNRTEEYLILLLSQGGVTLYHAINDGITHEIVNDDFPFSENKNENLPSDRTNDAKRVDDLVREYLNKVDKAVVKIYNETGLHIVVISTEDNFSRLMQVADIASVYLGHAPIDYNHISKDNIVKQSYEIVKKMQHTRRLDNMSKINEAIGQGNVLTDLQEIFQASLDGRGDLLMVHQDYTQPVLMTSDRTFDLAIDVTQPDVIDDITSNIAWNVLSKHGKVFFTSHDEEVNNIGEIVLKTRY